MYWLIYCVTIKQVGLHAFPPVNANQSMYHNPIFPPKICLRNIFFTEVVTNLVTVIYNIYVTKFSDKYAKEIFIKFIQKKWWQIYHKICHLIFHQFLCITKFVTKLVTKCVTEYDRPLNLSPSLSLFLSPNVVHHYICHQFCHCFCHRMQFITTFVINFVTKFGDSLNSSPNLVKNLVTNSSQNTLGLLAPWKLLWVYRSLCASSNFGCVWWCFLTSDLALPGSHGQVGQGEHL